MMAKPNQNLLWDKQTQSPNKFIFMKMTILLIIPTQKLLLKPWYMNVYLMVEGTHLILTMSCQLSRPRPDIHLKNHQEKSIPQRHVFARANQSTNHLVDRGANGGLVGADMRVLQKPDRKINIVGIDDHELTCLDVVTAAALLDTQKGPVIGIFHDYAHLGKGRSIHGNGQMEWFNCKVDDRSKVVGGAQRIETPDGSLFSLSIESGLVMCTPSGSLLM